MGSACTTHKADTPDVDGNVSTDIVEDIDESNFITDIDDRVDSKPKGPDCESIRSGSSGASRPPTPFSRPVTAAVIVRPKTTTISERAELAMDAEDNDIDVLDEEGDSEPENAPAALHPPPKIRRAGSRNGVEAAHGHVASLSRHVSRNIAEDDEQILKMKEYMEQKGL